MDKVSKFLSKLSPRERERVMPIVGDITRGSIAHLNYKKLKGRDNEYRMRVGSVRIQFVKISCGNIITRLGFKGDTTYR